MECSNGAFKTAFDIQVDGKCALERPEMTWQQLIRGIAESGSSGLLTLDPHDRHTWRSCMRSTMHAASQLPGKGPTDVDVASVPAC